MGNLEGGRGGGAVSIALLLVYDSVPMALYLCACACACVCGGHLCRLRLMSKQANCATKGIRRKAWQNSFAIIIAFVGRSLAADTRVDPHYYFNRKCVCCAPSPVHTIYVLV